VSRASWLADALARWVPEHLEASGATDVEDVAITLHARPPSGQSNETVPFSAAWRIGLTPYGFEAVARVQPTRHPMFLDPDVLREAAALVALGGAGVPVPRILGSVDAAFAGTAFFVMERVDGHVPFGRPSVQRDPWLVALDPDRRRRAWTSAMETVLAVHAVEPSEVVGILTHGEGDHTLAARLERVDAWLAWAAKGRSFPILEHALEHLRSWAAGFAPAGPAVVLWGDARLGNMIFGEDLRVAAAIDWETASVGPRELDLGWWLMMDDYATRAVGIDSLDGFPSAEETRSFYRERAGIPLPDLDQFELLAAVELAITLIRTGDALVARGTVAADSRFSRDNVPTQMVACRLGLAVPELSPDYRRLARVGETAGG
jgi:aminoglycoside phosphotransferase (APT) family kinase protein